MNIFSFKTVSRVLPSLWIASLLIMIKIKWWQHFSNTDFFPWPSSQCMQRMICQTTCLFFCPAGVSRWASFVLDFSRDTVMEAFAPQSRECQKALRLASKPLSLPRVATLFPFVRVTAKKKLAIAFGWQWFLLLGYRPYALEHQLPMFVIWWLLLSALDKTWSTSLILSLR